ncbi:MAG TPA: radical SAM protein [Candidatus Limnocylindrales bacterium]|nr:radical SAM protein [Candidatus Limnocylindrales bacterium]
MVAPEYREEPCRTALNKVSGMSFRWSLNPYTGCAHRCTFCFVRAFEARADRPYDDRYGRSIRIKVNVAEVLERELARRSWQREKVVVGTATDPYQPAEGRYRLTRACLVRLAASRTPLHLITRGPLILRDIDVLSEAARSAGVSVTFSVPTVDPEVWRRTEPGTAPPRQRLRALSRLVAAGLDVGVGMAPILPGISDSQESLAAVVRAARDAGATGIWANLLYLRHGTREHFLDNLARDWPELLPMYARLYAGRDYLGKAELGPVQRQVAELRRQYDVRDRRTVRLEEKAVDATWAPDAEGPSQLELPLAPGEQPPASLVA